MVDINLGGEDFHVNNRPSATSIFHTCPIDIVLRILELVALDTSTSCSNICLISKAISRIARPLLYHTVSLRFLHQELRFLTTIQTTQYGQMTINLLLYNGGNSPLGGYRIGFEVMIYQRIILMCPNIQRLLFNMSSPPIRQVTTTPWPSPRELSLTASGVQKMVLLDWLKHPLLRNVTHLYLDFFPNRWDTPDPAVAAAAFLDLRQLTHLCLRFNYRRASHTLLDSLLEALLRSHDSLRILLLLSELEDGRLLKERGTFISKVRNWEFLLGITDKNSRKQQLEGLNNWEKIREMRWEGTKIRKNGDGNGEVGCIASWSKLL